MLDLTQELSYKVVESIKKVEITTNLLHGVDSLDSFVLTSSNNSLYASQLFRVSNDFGCTYGDWIELNEVNLNAVTFDKIYYSTIQFSLVKSGEPIFSSFNISVTFKILPNKYSVLSKSYLNFGINNYSKVLEYSGVLMRKICEKGIVAEYVERTQHFRELFFPICFLRSLFRFYELRYKNLINDEELLRFWLDDSGVYYNQVVDDLSALQSYSDNLFNVFTQRGTNQPFIKQENGEFGEFLRLINYGDTIQDFGFSLAPKENVGFNVNNSSPLYRGLFKDYNVNKTPEASKDFINLLNWGILNPSAVSIVTDVDKDVLKITGVANGASSGISYDLDQNKLIKISPIWGYEISFYVKQEDLGTYIDFGVDIFNSSKALIKTHYFFQKVELNKNDKYYFVRGLLFPFYDTVVINPLNIGFGENVKMDTEHAYLYPIITVNNADSVTNNINLHNLKVKFLNTKFSRGFIQNPNLFFAWIYNNNEKYSKESIVEKLTFEFLPYNTYLNENIIDYFDFEQYDFLLSSFVVETTKVGLFAVFFGGTSASSIEVKWTDTTIEQYEVGENFGYNIALNPTSKKIFFSFEQPDDVIEVQLSNQGLINIVSLSVFNNIRLIDISSNNVSDIIVGTSINQPNVSYNFSGNNLTELKLNSFIQTIINLDDGNNFANRIIDLTQQTGRPTVTTYDLVQEALLLNITILIDDVLDFVLTSDGFRILTADDIVVTTSTSGIL